MDMDQKTIQCVRRLTRCNNHGEAYLVAAKALGDDDLTMEFTRINRRHTELGFLPSDLYEERYAAYRNLMSAAGKALAPEVYRRLYMAF